MQDELSRPKSMLHIVTHWEKQKFGHANEGKAQLIKLFIISKGSIIVYYTLKKRKLIIING